MLNITKYRLPVGREIYTYTIPSEFGTSTDAAQSYALGRLANEAGISTIDKSIVSKLKSYESREAISIIDNTKILKPHEREMLRAFLTGYNRPSLLHVPAPVAEKKEDYSSLLEERKWIAARTRVPKDELRLNLGNVDYFKNLVHPMIGPSFGHDENRSYPIVSVRLQKMPKKDNYLVAAESQGHSFIVQYDHAAKNVKPLVSTVGLYSTPEKRREAIDAVFADCQITMPSPKLDEFINDHTLPEFLLRVAYTGSEDGSLTLHEIFNGKQYVEKTRHATGQRVFDKSFHNSNLAVNPPGINAVARTVAAVPDDLERKISTSQTR